nr:Fic family protein [Nannocystis sp.]
MTENDSETAGKTERASVESPPAPMRELSEDERAEIEARNALLQTDLMLHMVESAIDSGGFRLRPSTLCDLQKPAVLDLQPDAGFFRRGSIGISNTDHVPPPASDVARLVEELCDYVNDNWREKSPIHLAAYVMWKHNWIHPFSDGNGRTSRCVSYLVLCVKLGYRLPGKEAVPERIAADKFPYYHALDAADAAWKTGTVDVSAMEALLSVTLAQQLLSVHSDATGADFSS